MMLSRLRAVVALPVVLSSLLLVRAQERSVADGVYSEAQATRGAAAYDQACSNCHRADLSGNTGPALKEQRFAQVYAGKDLRTLYTKIATTMPRQTPGSLSDDVYLDIVAYVLKENGFVAGSAELASNALDGIRVVPGRPKPPPPIGDYSYVDVVGCLTRGDKNTWTLTRASDPVVATSAPASDAPATALGTRTFHLLDALAYGPDGHRDHKMHVRGLLIRLPGEDRLTISAIQMIAPSCGG